MVPAAAQGRSRDVGEGGGGSMVSMSMFEDVSSNEIETPPLTFNLVLLKSAAKLVDHRNVTPCPDVADDDNIDEPEDLYHLRRST